MLVIDHCSFENVGYDSRNKYDAAVSLYGVQEINVTNSIFKRTKDIKMHLVVGEPKVNVSHLALAKEDMIQVSGDQKYSIGVLYTDGDSSNKSNDEKHLGPQL